MKSIILLLLFLSSFLSAQWEVISPVNPTSSFYTIAFADNNTGFTAGESGEILKTTDAGYNWLVTADLSTQINKLYCVNVNTVFAVGNNGKIFKSADGGFNWIEQTSNTSNQLNSVYFKDENHGIAVGSNSTLLRTTDGGNNWLTVSGNFFTLNDVKYDASWNPVICGSQGIYLSSDNGITWSKKVTPDGFSGNSFSFISNETGWCAGSKDIIETNDGGYTWEVVSDMTLRYGDIHAFDEENSYLLSSFYGTHEINNYFRKTTDGWASSTQNLLAVTKSHLLAMHFFDQNSGIIVGENGLIIRTDDGGNTWASANGISDNMYTVDITGDNTIWMCGENGTILKSQDNGESWSVNSSFQFPAITKCKFISESEGWIATYGNFHSGMSIYYTSDNGTSWTKQFGNPHIYPVGFNMPSPDTLFILIGGEDALYRTTDKGDTWIKTSSMYTNIWHAFHFVDPQNGIVIGEYGKIEKSSDGGYTWQEVTSPVNSNLYDLCFVDNQSGFAAGNAGTVIKTTDAGISWSIIDFVNSKDLNNICFVSTQKGWVTDSDGSIYVTKDGGNNWNKESDGSSFQLNDLRVHNTGYGIAAGNNGTVIKYNASTSLPQEVELPKEYSLAQNYPNPFNPTTTIRYSLAEASNVTINVFDILGREIIQLVNKHHLAGNHSVQFNAANLPSGIYIYKIEAGNFNAINKMILMK